MANAVCGALVFMWNRGNGGERERGRMDGREGELGRSLALAGASHAQSRGEN